MTASISSLILLFLALLLGLNLPDLDHQVSFLVHRSIVTHGFIVPLLVFFTVYHEKVVSSRFFSIGFSLASVIHLCFDLFPKAWIGFALIHIPLWGRTGALFSWLWMGLSIIICLYFALVLIKSLIDLIVALGSLGLAFSFYAASQTLFLPALIALLVATGIVLALPGNCREIIRGVAPWRKIN